MADRNKHLVKFGLGKAKPGQRFVNLGKVTNVVETWTALTDRLRKVHRTPETFKDFLSRPKDGIQGQDALKASAGFWIGCPCRHESRQYANLMPRTIIAFDMDTLTPEGLAYIASNEHVLKNYLWAAHTTRKHTDEAPRLRVIVALAKPIPSELYEPVARMIASLLDKNLRWTDAVSFRPTQLMYLPTASADNPFEFFEGPGERLVDHEAIFDLWRKRGLDPLDVRNWPRKAEEDALRLRKMKAEDPWEKPGIIGAFSRVYPIERLIEEHLSEFYVPGDQNSTDVRYSAVGSSTSNGLVIYEDGRFATSNHGTDPIAGLSVNAWDMARICLYGDLDDPNTEIEITKRPSYKAMVSFARGLPDVQEDMLQRATDFDAEFDEEEALDEAAAEGDSEFFDGAEAEADPHADLDDEERELLGLPAKTVLEGEVLPPEARPTKPPEDWRTHLQMDPTTSEFENNLPNVVAIMRYDPRWFGKVRFNELQERAVIQKPVRFKNKPWSNITVLDTHNGDPIEDHHRAVFRAVMESATGSGNGKGGYGLTSVSQVNLGDAIDLAARTDAFHPVKALLGPVCKWDGKPRLSTALQTWLEVPDSAFVREAFTLMMVAAVARTYEPGHKFDHALIIQGAQGAGKSTFLRYLGKIDWHREFDIGFDNDQKIAEKLAGAIIVEMGELAGFSKSEVEDAKQVMSATETVVRMAYGRTGRVFKRRCVWFGTTNDKQPLKDTTGNRRWWVVNSMRAEQAGISDLNALAAEVDQMWHEARHIYDRMRAAQPHGDLPLTLSREARLGADRAAEGAMKESEFSIMADQIEAWLSTPASIREIQNRDTENPGQDDDKLVLRSRFSPLEAWTEALGMDAKFFAKEAWRVTLAVNAMSGWERGDRKEKFHGVRVTWVFRRDASFEERRRGYLDPEPSDIEDDLIG